jgi:hypothetical protein
MSSEDLRAAYAVLDLPQGASAEEVRAAYLDLVKIWHPDRHEREPERLRLRAQEKLKDITAAYEKLSAKLTSASGRAADLGALARNLSAMDFGEHWGYVDDSGKMAIYPEFAAARDFRDGLGAVRIAEKWGYIDHTGACCVTPLYEECRDFSEGLAAVKWYGRWGYIGRDGSFVVQPRFQEAGPFQDGWGEVRVGARLGRVNRQGEIVFIKDRLAAAPEPADSHS